MLSRGKNNFRAGIMKTKEGVYFTKSKTLGLLSANTLLEALFILSGTGKVKDIDTCGCL
jgi:hypothetical protein